MSVTFPYLIDSAGVAHQSATCDLLALPTIGDVPLATEFIVCADCEATS